MSEAESRKLFKCLEQLFDDMDKKLDQVASQSSLDSLQHTVDRFIDKLESKRTNAQPKSL